MSGRRTVVPLSPTGTARQRLAPEPAWSAALPAELRDADLGEESAFLAWQLATWATELGVDEREALLRLVARSLMSVAAGSTRLPLEPAERDLVLRATSIAGPPGARKPLVVEGAHLYHQKLLACEDRLVATVAARAATHAPFSAAAVDAALAAVVATAVPVPTAEQQAAVRAALTRRLAVVSGGPGTGKTTIVLAIVRALVRLGMDASAIALAAPTGKAANRLEEALKGGLARLVSPSAEDAALATTLPAAETLHRLLGYSPRTSTFLHHENNRLAPKVVIVDEGSMIDLVLMERLSRALADDATLVLLGDADQLPSVEAGAVFRDLLLPPLAVHLTQSHRMDPGAGGRRILEAAGAVRVGDTAALGTLVVERPAPAAVTFDGVELTPGAGREALLERWYAERLAALPRFGALCEHVHTLENGALRAEDAAALEALHDHHARRRILCVTRARPTGVEATNDWLHRRHGGRAAFAPGEPVMMLRNDYERGLFNGDQGVVVRLRDGGARVRLAAAFRTRTGWMAWDIATLRDTLALAYAITVHKAQGSELDEALLLLPDEPLPLATRELIYTAVTRSRRAIVVCGAPAVLTAAVARPTLRSSGIAEKLRALI